jgi:hypothetical protein
MTPHTNFAPLLERFFTQRLITQRQVSPHTIASYRDTFRLFLQFARGRTKKAPSDLAFSDVHVDLVEAFLTDLETSRGISARSRNLRLSALRSFFRYAAYHEPTHAARIQQILAIPAKRHDRKLVDFLSRAEMEALLAAPDMRTWNGRRDHALLLVAFQTGMRLSELTSLRINDVELTTGAHLRCLGKGRKERCTPLTAQTVRVLKAWIQEPKQGKSDILFPTVHGQRMSADAVQYLLAKYTRLPLSVNINLNLNITARPDLAFFSANYVFATPVLGGQLAVGLGEGFGRSTGEIDGTLTAIVGNLVATRSGSISDERFGFSDLYPTASLRWNNGVHNYMTYITGDIPVGTYDPTRLANVGIGHGAIDSGAGYTYFDSKSGHEFSVVSGLTYNFKNTETDYQNGIDWHLDWGASQFLTKQWQVGLVGYFYDQLTRDIGAPAILDGNISRVAGIGPQIGYIIPMGSLQGYINLKGYGEFDAEHRAAGWSAWVSFAISPAAAPPPAPTRRTITK